MVRYTSAQGDWKHANQTHRGRLRSRLDDRLAWPSSSVGHRIAAGPIHFRLCGFPIRRRPAGFPAGRLYIGGVPTKEFGTMAPFPIVKDCVKASKPPTGATLPNHVTSSSQCRDAHGEPRGASQKAAILAAILQTPSGHPIAAGPIHFRLCGFPIRRRPAGFPAGRLRSGDIGCALTNTARAPDCRRADSFQIVRLPDPETPRGVPRRASLHWGGYLRRNLERWRLSRSSKTCVKAPKPPTGATLPNRVTGSSQCRDAHGEPRGASQNLRCANRLAYLIHADTLVAT